MLRSIPRWRLTRCSLPAATAAWRVTQTTTTMPWMVRRTMATATATATTATTTTAVAPPAPIQLRAYQEECIQAVLAAIARGQTRVGISLATGAGKTVIFTELVGRVRRGPDDDAAAAAAAGGVARTQTLILAHRRELVEQAVRHCARAYPDATVEVEMGAVQASGTADITVASVQTLAAGGGRRLAKLDARRFKLVLVDEAHHIVAPGYMRVLSHFGLARGEDDASEASKTGEASKATSASRPVLVGVSATFSRYDGLALGAAIDEIVYHRDYVDMIGDGWLADMVFTTVASTADLSRVASSRSSGDFRTKDLSNAVNTPEVNDITVRTWLARAGPAAVATGLNSDGLSEGHPRRATLVFCVDRRHVADLTAAFRRHGVDAQAVTSDTDKRERARRLDAFQRGAFPVLLNCGVFTEGTDLPAVDCVVLARPTRSRNLLVQMIGRGLRLHAGKTNCHVIDMVASLDAGIVTTPTLFGLDPGTLVEAASVADLRAIRDDGAPRTQEEEDDDDGDHDERQFQSLRVTDYASVFDLMTDTAGERHIHTMTPNAWVVVGPDRYVLTGPDGTYLRLERLEGDDSHSVDTDAPAFRVVELRALPRGVAKSPFAAPREVCRAPTLAAALHGADSYAAVLFPRAFIYRYQRWRRDAATPGQRAFLETVAGGRRKKAEHDDDNPPKDSLLPAGLTRGAAADMITKIKHGARGRFAELAALQRRRAREDAAAARAETRRRRQQVQVGALPL